MILTDKKDINKIALLFMFTYMISYMTRINYGAVLLSMEEATRFSGAALSVAVTGSFITYGIGQVISGVIGDRYSPKKLIFFGLLVSVFMNACIPFCPSPVWMAAVWCINGFAQALMWPPMVRLMTVLYAPETYKKITVRVSWGSCLGTVFVYLFAPLLITMSGWKSVFFFCAACGGIMAVIWKGMCPEVGRVRTVKTEAGKKGSGLFAPMMLVIMLAVVAQGALRDSVTTWMPTYISDTYNMGSAVSTYGVAVISDKAGWNATLWTWVFIAAVGTVCCAVCIRPFRRKHGDFQ